MSASILLDTPASVPKAKPHTWEEIRPKVELISDDGEPMESDWHVKEMVLLISCIDQRLAGREDYYVGGNMFIYFSEEQARDHDFRGPDFFFVWNTTRKPLRPYWAIWEEGGRTPNVVIELGSPTTIKEDHGPKKDTYESILHVHEYFCYNPKTEKLEGWRHNGKKFVPIKANAQGRLWSEELGLWLGVWKGKVGHFDDTWLRFFDRDGKLVLSEHEAEHHLRVEAQAEVARLRAKLAARDKKAHGPDANGKRKKK